MGKRIRERRELPEESRVNWHGGWMSLQNLLQIWNMEKKELLSRIFIA